MKHEDGQDQGEGQKDDEIPVGERRPGANGDQDGEGSRQRNGLALTCGSNSPGTSRSRYGTLGLEASVVSTATAISSPSIASISGRAYTSFLICTLCWATLDENRSDTSWVASTNR